MNLEEGIMISARDEQWAKVVDGVIVENVRFLASDPDRMNLVGDVDREFVADLKEVIVFRNMDCSGAECFKNRAWHWVKTGEISKSPRTRRW